MNWGKAALCRYAFILPVMATGGACPSDLFAEVGNDEDVLPSSVATGVCVQIVSRHPDYVVKMGMGGSAVVHALAPDDVVTREIRDQAVSNRLYGLVSAQTQERLDHLPYARRLVNRVVVDDWAEALGRGLTMAEALRIAAPGGDVWIGRTTVADAKKAIAEQRVESPVEEVAGVANWVRIRPGRPAGMDEWTHTFRLNAGNRQVSRDSIDMARQNLWVQWMDGEMDPVEHHGSMGALIAVKGRFVSLSNAEAGALIHGGYRWRHGKRQTYVLSCRDAFNGTVLWMKPWRGVTMNIQLAAKNALASDGVRVYTVEEGCLVARRLADGEFVYSASASAPFDQFSVLLCASNLVVVYDRLMGELRAFRAEDGSPAWSWTAGPGMPSESGMVAIDGDVVICTGESLRDGTNTVRELQALNLGSGSLLWKKATGGLLAEARLTGGVGRGNPRKASESDEGAHLFHDKESHALPLMPWQQPLPFDSIRFLRAGEGIGVAGTTAQILVVKLDTGKALYRVSGDGPPYMVGEYLTSGSGKSEFFELQTGVSVGTFDKRIAGWGRWGCGSVACLTESMFLGALRAGHPEKGARPVESSIAGFVGSVPSGKTCITGDIVANNLVYQPQQYCGCAGGATKGLFAVSAVDPMPPREAFLEPGPLEEGPAFGSAEEIGAAGGDWPMYRRDLERSCGGEGNVPRDPRVLWTRSLAVRPDGPIVRNSWRSQYRHNQALSAPVIAAGRVIVALVDEHQVVSTTVGGEVVWRYTANARIDSPPTLHRGLCVFGCRDGWVYCLRSSDGQLVWRRRIAPVDERIAVYGQLESRYAVIGSVAIAGGMGYATAGDSLAVGVMLWVFDPFSGRSVEYRQIPRRLAYHNDVLVRGDDGGLCLGRTQVVPPVPVSTGVGAGGVILDLRTPGHLFNRDNGLLYVSTTSVLRRRGDFMVRQLVADRWTWRGGRLFGYVASRQQKKSRLSELQESPPLDARPLAWERGKTASRTLPSVIVAVDVAQIESRRRRETFMATREDDSKGVLWECPHSNEVWCLATVGDAVIVGGPERETAPQSEKAPSGESRKSELAEGTTTEKKVNFAIKGDAWSPENLRALGWTKSWRDPFCSPGYLRILDGSNGQERAALRLPATPLQDGIAVADGRIYLTLADGSLTCVGR